MIAILALLIFGLPLAIVAALFQIRVSRKFWKEFNQGLPEMTYGYQNKPGDFE